MSNFWDLEDGTSAYDPNATSAELGGGEFELLPDKTVVRAFVQESMWKEYEGEDYINLKWVVLAPEQYKNRVIFQKLKVKSPEGKKRVKAIMMLNVINAACGMKLPMDREPTDADLATGIGRRPMALLVKVWDIDGKTGNYIDKIDRMESGSANSAPASKQQSKSSKPASSAPSQNFDNDIPF